jgi:hypothetical protein
LFGVIGALVVIRLIATQGLEAAAAGALAAVFFGTMVWFKDFWAGYVLTFGFWESKASDFKHPARSSAAVALLGWVFLILLAVGTFMS